MRCVGLFVVIALVKIPQTTSIKSTRYWFGGTVIHRTTHHMFSIPFGQTMKILRKWELSTAPPTTTTTTATKNVENLHPPILNAELSCIKHGCGRHNQYSRRSVCVCVCVVIKWEFVCLFVRVPKILIGIQGKGVKALLCAARDVQIKSMS